MSNTWLNYHHLYYFWTVAREGNITRASKILHLSQPTVSAQLKALEDVLGEKLLTRAGRGITLTELGQVVFRYAEEIFALGRELVQSISRHPRERELTLRVGISDAIPKLIAYRVLEPAFEAIESLKIVCCEGKLHELIEKMADHEIDLVISNSRFSKQTRGQLYHHALGSSGITFFATEKLPLTCDINFPQCLDKAPLLIPTSESAIREQLDAWFEKLDITPKIVGEFDDSALTQAFGEASRGVFVGPTAIEEEIQRHSNTQPIGRIDDVQESFFAISAERRIKHPAVVAICETARRNLFPNAKSSKTTGSREHNAHN